MNAEYIITVYVVVDEVLKVLAHESDSRAVVSDAEILTVALVAARYFQNRHESALVVLQSQAYIPRLSLSRFNRRLHALWSQLWDVSSYLSDLWVEGSVFIIDTMPLPACQWARRKRCRKAQGQAYRGYNASKKWHYWGWQLHLVCDLRGIPVHFEVLPASWDELDATPHLLADLPPGSRVLADKGYVSLPEARAVYDHGQVQLIAKQRKNMIPNTLEHRELLKKHRGRIETLFSQLQSMGIQQLHTRTAQGTGLKVLASLLAVTFTNVL